MSVAGRDGDGVCSVERSRGVALVIWCVCIRHLVCSLGEQMFASRDRPAEQLSAAPSPPAPHSAERQLRRPPARGRANHPRQPAASLASAPTMAVGSPTGLWRARGQASRGRGSHGVRGGRKGVGGGRGGRRAEGGGGGAYGGGGSRGARRHAWSCIGPISC